MIIGCYPFVKGILYLVEAIGSWVDELKDVDMILAIALYPFSFLQLPGCSRLPPTPAIRATGALSWSQGGEPRLWLFSAGERRCGMSYELNLKGQLFGFLCAEEKMPYKEDRYTVWRCHCTNCGGEAFVSTKRLKRGTITDCGCIPKTTAKNGSIAEDLTGRIFGDLKVLYRVENHRNGRTRWMCECICQNRVVVTQHELKAGSTKSCGCYKKNHCTTNLDLKNRQFGRLTALYPTEERDYKGSVMWHCRCKCMNELDVSADALVHGNYQSCGCLKKEIEQKIGSTLHRVDGSCVEILEKRKHRNDNTSGFRGVYKLANGRFRAGIGLKKQSFYLGTFDSFEEAVRIRLEAEKILHDGFVETYYLWEKRALTDPQWAEQHPFYYNVRKAGDQFIVSAISLSDDMVDTMNITTMLSKFSRIINFHAKPNVGQPVCSAEK